MKYTLEVSDQDAGFVLEFLRRVTSVKLTPLRRRAVKSVEMDTTEYLLSNPANAAFIRESREQLRRGETIQVDIPQQ